MVSSCLGLIARVDIVGLQAGAIEQRLDFACREEGLIGGGIRPAFVRLIQAMPIEDNRGMLPSPRCQRGIAASG